MQLPLDSIYISPKLQNKLDRIPSYPLTTVVAPAGYGKTTAVRWFCRRIPEEGTALRFSILGGGLSEFWHDLAENIGRAAGAPFAETMLKMGPPADTTTQREFLRLLRQFSPAGECYLFIDDYHLVESDVLTSFMLFISRNLPDRIHVVLISRFPIFGTRERLLLSGRVNEIEERDLRFDAQDIGSYFAQCGYPISAQEISHLSRISEGWAAALYLNLVSYADTGSFSELGDIHAMMGALLLEPLPPDEKELLTAMSMMLVFSAPPGAVDQRAHRRRDAAAAAGPGKCLHHLSAPGRHLQAASSDAGKFAAGVCPLAPAAADGVSVPRGRMAA